MQDTHNRDRDIMRTMTDRQNSILPRGHYLVMAVTWFSLIGCSDGSEPVPGGTLPQSASPASVSSQADSTAWPYFRGPGGEGRTERTGLPVKWSPDENIVWKTPLPGPGASSPIVVGDRVYLTCYTGYAVPGEEDGSLEQLQRHVLAYQLSNGKLIWDQSFAARLPEEANVRDHGYASSTPAADRDRIYVFLGKSGVIALDHDGKQIWHTDVGSEINGWGSAASPVLYQDLVIVNASVESESLVALDRKSGKEKWRVSGIQESWNTPVIVPSPEGKPELIVAIHGQILAFEPGTGKALWNCDTDIGWYMVPSPVSSAGVVYYLGGRSGIAALAVRTGGRGDVTGQNRLWTSDKGSNVSSPVLSDGLLFWIHDQRATAFCAKAATGDILYEQRLPRAGQVYASALLAGDQVYYLTREGKTFVVAAKPEFSQLAVNDLEDGGRFDASPAVAGNRLLIRSDKFLYCIGE